MFCMGNKVFVLVLIRYMFNVNTYFDIFNILKNIYVFTTQRNIPTIEYLNFKLCKQCSINYKYFKN